LDIKIEFFATDNYEIIFKIRIEIFGIKIDLSKFRYKKELKIDYICNTPSKIN
jgi:hypothetical protein